MGPDDVKVRPDGTVVVRLPAAKSSSAFIDERKPRCGIAIRPGGPLVAYSLDLERRARLAGVEAASQAALDMGILHQAELNAETSIRSLLGLAGVKAVQVIAPGPAPNPKSPEPYH
jgi:hypothetical protein